MFEGRLPSLKSRSSHLEIDSQATDLLNSDFNYLKQSHGHDHSNMFDQGGESPQMRLKKCIEESALKSVMSENAKLKELV